MKSHNRFGFLEWLKFYLLFSILIFNSIIYITYSTYNILNQIIQTKCDADTIHITRATCARYTRLLQHQGLDSGLVRSLILTLIE